MRRLCLSVVLCSLATLVTVELSASLSSLSGNGERGFCAHQRSEGTAWTPPAESPRIVVSGPHNAALGHWLDAVEDGKIPRAGVRLVHIDSHSDLLIDSPEVHPRRMSWPFELPKENHLFARAHGIGTFIAAALGLCVIDEIMWIRSEFKRGIYNPPPCGSYHLSLFRSHRNFWCYRTETAMTHRWCDGKSENEALDQAWNHPSCFHEHKAEETRFGLHVTSLRHALQSSSPGSAKKPWILDLDLDFFSVVDPTFTALSWLGIPEARVTEIQTCGKLTDKVLQDGHCKHNTIHFDQVVYRLAHTRSWKDLQRFFGCGSNPSNPEGVKAGTLDDFLGACASHWGALGIALDSNASDVVERDDLASLVWEGVSFREPHHVSTRTELLQMIQELAVFIRRQETPPVLVTVVQSFGNPVVQENGYVPADDATWLQGKVLGMLKATLNTTVSFDQTQEHPIKIGSLASSTAPYHYWNR